MRTADAANCEDSGQHLQLVRDRQPSRRAQWFADQKINCKACSKGDPDNISSPPVERPKKDPDE